MEPIRRSRPFWRNAIAPASVGLLWPALFCGFWFFFVSEFGNPLVANATSPNATSPDVAQDAYIREGFSHAYLEIAGQVVIDREFTHLGIPQLRPDGTMLAVDLFPTGTETMPFGKIQIFEEATGARIASFSGHNPAWVSSDQLEFVDERGRAMAYDVETAIFTDLGEAAAAVDDATVAAADAAILKSFNPTTIRVRHHPRNYCRGSTAANEIDEIPLEEYVARVVPAETPPRWDMEALKAQAIAARTYAVNHIYAKRDSSYEFDVSDWANNQVMCDYRHPRTDQAVSETSGIILSEIQRPGILPINAMYSAENGHPTLKHPILNYLDGVADVNAMGRQRHGHGWGLSQHGAQRLAQQGLNFCQILGHYYQEVTLNSAARPELRNGCLVVDSQSGFAKGAGLHIRALAGSDRTGLTVRISHAPGADSVPWTSLLPSSPPQTTPVPPAVTEGESLQIRVQTVEVHENLQEDAQTSSEDQVVVSADTDPLASPTPEDSTAPTPSSADGLQDDQAQPTPVSEIPTPEPTLAADSEPTPIPTPVAETVTEVTPTPLPSAEGPDAAVPSAVPVPSTKWPVTLDVSAGDLIWVFPSEVKTGDVLTLELLHGEVVLHQTSVTVDLTGPRQIDLALQSADREGVPQLSASATAGDSISVGRNWRWEQSALFFSTDSGELVHDPNASDGIVWMGDPRRHKAGTWYGPYTDLLPGVQSYRALFTLGLASDALPDAGDSDAAEAVARLDVAVDKGVRVLGVRELFVTDFTAQGELNTFPVDFHLFNDVEDLEFRVVWHGEHPVILDNIVAVTLPFEDWAEHPLPLPLQSGDSVNDLHLVAFDEADNMSTLFTLALGSTVSGQTEAKASEDCSWLGDCQSEAGVITVPKAAE